MFSSLPFSFLLVFLFISIFIGGTDQQSSTLKNGCTGASIFHGVPPDILFAIVCISLLIFFMVGLDFGFLFTPVLPLSGSVFGRFFSLGDKCMETRRLLLLMAPVFGVLITHSKKEEVLYTPDVLTISFYVMGSGQRSRAFLLGGRRMSRGIPLEFTYHSCRSFTRRREF